MVSRYKARIALLSAVLAVSAGVLSFDNSQEFATNYNACVCSSNSLSQRVSASECQREAHTSWAAWLTGGSASGQFHYLDLLELLIGSKDNQSSSKVSSPY
ncbi:hypothetical protein EAG18_10310 [Pseudoalteromonas sp. J010]|uniref:hypothetical protein n=1 Tax=Pseudoalteromonas sp. J010 TaxID=998465 RepID=UPI000F64D9EB|nr:hypothetical protein [Pseudoalteromonas sp. J010]RRS08752.1 hypothetical protein EAG18_10310 [Pseudoalteromonas sp. J010]